MDRLDSAKTVPFQLGEDPLNNNLRSINWSLKSPNETEVGASLASVLWRISFEFTPVLRTVGNGSTQTPLNCCYRYIRRKTKDWPFSSSCPPTSSARENITNVTVSICNASVDLHTALTHSLSVFFLYLECRCCSSFQRTASYKLLLSKNFFRSTKSNSSDNHAFQMLI